MSHRAHLTSVGLASAFRQACLIEPYGAAALRGDLFAGVTVGLIAIPLSMALAIASGVPPQHGLYTAIVAGAVIALSGGSRYSISGPTAAFVVILHPVVQTFGIGGLMMATLMAGGVMILMALARLGRLIEYISPAVVLGFTAGIAVVIATLQVESFLGLSPAAMPEGSIGRVTALVAALPSVHWPTATVGAATLGTLMLWPRLRLALPGHLPAVLVGVGVALVLGLLGEEVETIGSRFTYTLADGSQGRGIAPVLPALQWPWRQPGPDGAPIVWSLENIRALMPSALSIAALGAIESLLCAMALDAMSGRRHSANGELLGQGIGNVVAPFFGGITATAAIARSSAAYQAGARSPVAGVVHALVVAAALVVLAPWLAYVPMASMAALLLMVAWKMSEVHKVRVLLRRAPAGDILVLLVCFSLTVVFDMVIAIAVGVVLASLLFMRDVAGMTQVREITQSSKLITAPVPADGAVYKITGPLFFAAADRVFSELAERIGAKRAVVLYMDAVPVMDAGGVAALEAFVARMERMGTEVIVADLQFQPLKTVARAGLRPQAGRLVFASTLAEGLEILSAGLTGGARQSEGPLACHQ